MNSAPSRRYCPLTEAMPELRAVADPATGRDTHLLLHQERKDVTWGLDARGRKPGHGLLVLRSARIRQGDRVADLCSGPLALFARFAVEMGAMYAEAVELDADLAKSAGETCQNDTRIHVLQGDLADVSRISPFDQVFVHPPMLARPSSVGAPNSSGQVGHDVASHSKQYHVGGTTGRETLDRAITVAREILRPGGMLVIAQFEFLGVEVPFSDDVPSTFDILGSAGFSPSEVHHYTVPLTEQLQDNLDVIRAVYPKYSFTASGEQEHRFSVVHAVRT